jgi:hypothetical protein
MHFKCALRFYSDGHVDVNGKLQISKNHIERE